MTIQAGMRGHAPCVLIRPIVKYGMTVGLLKQALEGVPDDVFVMLDTGPLNSLLKDMGTKDHPEVVLRSAK